MLGSVGAQPYWVQVPVTSSIHLTTKPAVGIDGLIGGIGH